ncbi:MAG: imidazoleglycerol-phosphate dehydratase HisB [bacterium]
MKRIGSVKRDTKETNIDLKFVLDGKGNANIRTKIPFFDHMLTLMAKHGLFNLDIVAKGDIEVDDHHTVEDMGICLGEALRKALGDKRGVKRFGYARLPMDEALGEVSIDISGRAFFVFNVNAPAKRIKRFEVQLVEEFMRAFVNTALITLHVNLIYGKNTHHIYESIFKALGKALDEATAIDARQRTIPSTKGIL